MDAFLDLCWRQENRQACRSYDLPQLALEVYSQCRSASNHNSVSKSLTNFGMSSARECDINAMVSAVLLPSIHYSVKLLLYW